MKTQTIHVTGFLPEDYDKLCRILFHIVGEGLNYFITEGANDGDE